jgi:hypothetical protein
MLPLKYESLTPRTGIEPHTQSPHSHRDPTTGPLPVVCLPFYPEQASDGKNHKWVIGTCTSLERVHTTRLVVAAPSTERFDAGHVYRA